MAVAVAVAVDAVREAGLVKRLEEPGPDGFRRSWIMLFPVGKFSHPEYGTLNFTRARLSDIKRNFDARVRHIDVALDANHDQDKATGWLESVELRDGGLWGHVRWTPLGEKYLREQIYRYFSPEFGDWTDPQTGKQYHDVLMGGALTNRPFLKEMPAVQLAGGEVSTRAWGSVDKAKLPDSAFLDPENRRLPVYEGTGEVGPDGRYTKRGKLNINGVKAALAAVHGARSGKPMSGLPAGTAAKLQRWLDRYSGGGSGDGASSQEASEGGEVMGTTKMLMGKSGSSSGSLVGEPLGPHAVGGDMHDECEDPEEGAQFDDADGDFDGDSNTHGPMTVKSHTHGKYAAHGHDGDADHSDAALADDAGMAYAEPDEENPDGEDEEAVAKRKSMSGGSKKATEPAAGMTLAEASKRLREMEYKLYERDVDDVLKALTDKLPERYALSKVFDNRLRKWLLGGGYQLGESRRGEVLEIIKLALSERALVDESKLGDAFTQETRVTVRQGGPNAGQNVPEDENRLVELAGMLALSDKKLERGQKFTELNMADRERYMAAAAKEIGYK